MRKVLGALGLLAVASAIVAPAASASDRCYTLGLPGYPHYEYCTHLPIDPSPR